MTGEDLKIIQEMMAEAQMEAFGCERKADWARALEDSEVHRVQVVMASVYRDRAAALERALEILAPVVVQDIGAEAEPETRRPVLKLID